MAKCNTSLERPTIYFSYAFTSGNKESRHQGEQYLNLIFRGGRGDILVKAENAFSQIIQRERLYKPFLLTILVSPWETSYLTSVPLHSTYWKIWQKITAFPVIVCFFESTGCKATEGLKRFWAPMPRYCGAMRLLIHYSYRGLSKWAPSKNWFSCELFIFTCENTNSPPISHHVLSSPIFISLRKISCPVLLWRSGPDKIKKLRKKLTHKVD